MASMTSPKTIVTWLMDTLKAADTLSEFKERWLNGEPPQTSWPKSPWGWVEWSGGPKEASVGTKAKINDAFSIVLVVKNRNQSTAEEEAADYCAAIETLLSVDLSLGALVGGSWVSNREKEKIFNGDYSIVAVRITVQTWRR